MDYQESIALHLGGNYIFMPIAFLVFFVYTQMLFENANPDPDHILSYAEAQHASLAPNVCVDGDVVS